MVTQVPIFYHDFWGRELTKPESHKSYRPVTIFSFRINHWLSEFNAVTMPIDSTCEVCFVAYSIQNAVTVTCVLEQWGFHLTNVVLHATVRPLVRRRTLFTYIAQENAMEMVLVM